LGAHARTHTTHTHTPIWFLQAPWEHMHARTHTHHTHTPHTHTPTRLLRAPWEHTHVPELEPSVVAVDTNFGVGDGVLMVGVGVEELSHVAAAAAAVAAFQLPLYSVRAQRTGGGTACASVLLHCIVCVCVCV